MKRQREARSNVCAETQWKIHVELAGEGERR